MRYRHMSYSYHKSSGWATRPNYGKALYQTKAGKWITVVVYWRGICKDGKERAKVGFEGKGPSDDFWVDGCRLKMIDEGRVSRDWKDDNDIFD